MQRREEMRFCIGWASARQITVRSVSTCRVVSNIYLPYIAVSLRSDTLTNERATDEVPRRSSTIRSSGEGKATGDVVGVVGKSER